LLTASEVETDILFLCRSVLEMVCLAQYVVSVPNWSVLVTALNCRWRRQICY